MSFWRSPKRPKAAPQPNLPGLFTPSPERPMKRRLASSGERALEVARSRLVFAGIMFSIVYLVIGARLVGLTLFSEPPDLVASALSSSSDAPISSRADMTDRNGTLLATSLPTISVCANTRKMIDPDEAARKLVEALPDLDQNKLLNDLRNGKSCTMIKRHLTPKQTYALNRLGIAGLEYMPDERRIYPLGGLMAHVLGYTDIDNRGLAGMEKYLDTRLQQEPTPVALTLDLRVQTILHRELTAAVQEYRAEAATGLVMDISNGEILAMVSLPDFDPHRPGAADSDAKFNRATLGVYEMGSTFKIFNTALAMDSGLIRPGDVFDTTHPIEVGHRTIRDFHAADHNLNVAEILIHSSNLGSARMAERLGSARQRAFLSRLGLLDKVPLELPEVGTPLVPSAASWSDVTTMTVSYGHGVAVNAVQTAAAVSSILNDGFKVRPTLLKGATQNLPQERVVSQRASMQMRGMMRLVVSHGTGKKANVAGYLVGGKTGTADKVNGKHYSENSRRASFVGAFPIQAPRYLVMVILDDPKGTSKTAGFANAGWNAAPTVGHIISQAGPLLGVEPMDSDIADAAEQQLQRQLGADTLQALQIGKGEDYAAHETDDDQ